MALPGIGSYDSLFDQLIIGADAQLGQAQLLYGSVTPVKDAAGNVTGYKYTDGTEQQKLSSEYGYGSQAALNPFNKLSQLQRQQANDAYDQTNNAASMGNLSSGGYLKRQSNLLYQQGVAQHNLSQEYLDRQQGLQQQAMAAQSAHDSAILGGWSEALQRKIAAGGTPSIDPAAAPAITAAKPGTVGILPSLSGTASTAKPSAVATATIVKPAGGVAAAATKKKKKK